MKVTESAPSFAADIKPLFREGDRAAMKFAFDLWDRDDVAQHADAILAAVAQGAMPCDRRWEEPDVDKLRSWIAGGKAA
jgi:hypothetical protein